MADPRLEEFYRESMVKVAKMLTPEQRLNLIKELPAEERLEGLSDDEVAKALEARKRKANGSSPKP